MPPIEKDAYPWEEYFASQLTLIRRLPTSIAQARLIILSSIHFVRTCHSLDADSMSTYNDFLSECLEIVDEQLGLLDIVKSIQFPGSQN